MCLICSSSPAELAEITDLNCFYCPLLTSIPDLPKLTRLVCFSCHSLSALPVLPNLTTLYCADCPVLSSLPVLPNLTRLDCSYCPLLTSLPVLPNLVYLKCRGCPWLPQNATDHPLHRLAVLRLQAWFKRGHKQTFKRYIRTKAFNEWFWAGMRRAGAYTSATWSGR